MISLEQIGASLLLGYEDTTLIFRVVIFRKFKTILSGYT